MTFYRAELRHLGAYRRNFAGSIV